MSSSAIRIALTVLISSKAPLRVSLVSDSLQDLFLVLLLLCPADVDHTSQYDDDGDDDDDDDDGDEKVSMGLPRGELEVTRTQCTDLISMLSVNAKESLSTTSLNSISTSFHMFDLAQAVRALP